MLATMLDYLSNYQSQLLLGIHGDADLWAEALAEAIFGTRFYEV